MKRIDHNQSLPVEARNLLAICRLIAEARQAVISDRPPMFQESDPVYRGAVAALAEAYDGIWKLAGRVVQTEVATTYDEATPFFRQAEVRGKR